MILQSKLSGALVEATLETDIAEGSPLRGQTLLSIRKPDGSGTVLIAPYKAHEYRISSIDDAEYAVLREAGFDWTLPEARQATRTTRGPRDWTTSAIRTCLGFLRTLFNPQATQKMG